MADNKKHWETVYENKTPDQVSWTQERPDVSLKLIREASLPKTAKIIDVGGGDSKLVDFLLNDGYQNITVLDISEKALSKAKQRLGNQATQVNWIVCDITEFNPTSSYDLWHDRAAFHFLNQPEHIKKYVELTANFVNQDLIIGTFSKSGPEKCSGLNISQYDAQELCKVFGDQFQKEKCFTNDHTTPFNTIQNFQFCHFKKKS